MGLWAMVNHGSAIEMKILTASAQMASVQMLLRETTFVLLNVRRARSVVECCEVEASVDVSRQGIGAALSPLRFRDGDCLLNRRACFLRRGATL